MSTKVTVWAWAQAAKFKEAGKPLTPTELLVLLALADQARDNGLTWASSEWFAGKTGLNEKSIRRSAKTLCERGLLKVEQRPGITPKLWLQVATFTLEFTPDTESGVRGTEARRTPDTQSATPDTVSLTPDTVSDDPVRTCQNQELSHTRVRELAGDALADMAACPGIANLTPLKSLLSVDPPCTVEDLEDAVIAAAAWHRGRNGPRSMRSWTTARSIAIQNRDQRLAGAPAPNTTGGQPHGRSAPAPNSPDAKRIAREANLARAVHAPSIAFADRAGRG